MNKEGGVAVSKRAKILIWSAFGAYIALMLWLLFGQRWNLGGSENYSQRLMENLNLVPFRTIGEYMRVLLSGQTHLRSHAMINLAGNVVMFVPLGFFLPLVAKSCRTYWKHLLWVLLILLCIEVLQLVTLLGSCDVDDFLLNIPGTAIGYGLFSLFIRNKMDKYS